LELKTGAKVIEGTLSPVIRNRANMFGQNHSSYRDDPLRSTLPSMQRSTKHGATPYSYDTTWLTHPNLDSSLGAQSASWRSTAFMSELADADRAKMGSIRAGRVISLRRHLVRQEELLRAKEQHLKDIEEGSKLGRRRTNERYQEELAKRTALEEARMFQ
jgi:hypothetical protein